MLHRNLVFGQTHRRMHVPILRCRCLCVCMLSKQLAASTFVTLLQSKLSLKQSKYCISKPPWTYTIHWLTAGAPAPANSSIYTSNEHSKNTRTKHDTTAGACITLPCIAGDGWPSTFARQQNIINNNNMRRQCFNETPFAQHYRGTMCTALARACAHALHLDMFQWNRTSSELVRQTAEPSEQCPQRLT